MADSTTVKGVITVLAGEALEPYRRVKYSGSNDGAVTYADASDGDSWIGITLPNVEGDGTASGDPISIELRNQGNTIKCQTGSAMSSKNATVYPSDDGKVQATGSVTIGTLAADSTGASGGYVSFHPTAAAGSAPDEEAIAVADATTDAGIVIGLEERGLTALATTHEIGKPARDLRLCRAWGVCRNGTTDSDVLLKVGATAICAAITFTATDETVEFQLTDAVTEVAAASTIYASIATALTAPGMDIFIQCIPV